ncbi:MAG TPA: hypothetical protein VLT47_07320 [Anaeromyxobacteraceae bacterium]|nr:hypothetical protein [Anaeromyxobacteraceae bacterium]
MDRASVKPAGDARQFLLSRVRGRSITGLVLLAFAACSGGKGEPAPSGGLGRRVAAAEARAMLPSPDGAWVAWLDGCRVARGQFLPPGTANCDLRIAPSGGGDAKRIAGAVTTMPQGLSWSPSGATLAALADYDYAAGSGTLVLWRDGAARELARDVTFHGFGAHGELGYVAAGRLHVLLPGEEAPRAIEGAEGISSFALSPVGGEGCGADADFVRLLARRSRAAGGQVLAVGCRLVRARPLTGVEGAVTDYGFSADGTRLAVIVDGKGGGALRQLPSTERAPGSSAGVGVQSFAFAPSGETTAFVADATPGKQGNLYLAEPRRLPAVLAGREVGEYRWARGSARLAWLEHYDPRVRSGMLGVGGPGQARWTFGRNITDFDLAPDGKAVAFLQHTTRGGYSVDLFLASLEGAAAVPRSIAQGVFGFGFSPDGRWLYYRTRCTRNGEGCDLERVPASGLPKDGKPEPIAQGMKSFEFDPRDPARLLIGYQRTDRQALDVAVWKDGKLVRVDQVILPGSARFLGPDSKRLGYAVIDPKRAGVYVAPLPP